MNLQQLLQAFASEIEALAPELQSCLAQLQAPANEDAFLGSVQLYASHMQRIADAAQTADLTGLQQAAGLIMENAMLLAVSEPEQRVSAWDFFARWPALWVQCLRQPDSGESASALVQHLCTAPQALAPAAALILMHQLGRMGQQADSAQAASAITTAAPVADTAALSLQLPADLDPDLLHSFYQESPQQARRLVLLLQGLQGVGQGKFKAGDLAQAQRLAHTLKGTGAIFGLRGISSLAHPLEDILEYLHTQPRPEPALLALALNASHGLEQMVASVAGQDEPPSDALALLQTLLEVQQQLQVGLEPKIPSRPTPTQVAKPTSTSAAAEAAQDSHRADMAPTTSIRIEQAQLEEIFRLSGQVRIAHSTQQGRLKKMGERVQLLLAQNARWQKGLQDLERALQAQQSSQLARQSAGDFDPLELDAHSALQDGLLTVQEAANDVQLASLRVRDELQHWALSQQSDTHLSQTLQHEVLQARMRSVASIGPRAERTVRITAQSTGKQAQLQIEGGQVRMDAALLGSLIGPLMHLLRNAVDHGIESPEQRRAAGKAEIGQVRLAFTRLGSQVSLRCQDDGSGLDFGKVRQRASALGLLQEGQSYSPQEQARWIFAPGFSTRSQVNEISGRGLGLDVVHSWAASVGGSVDVVLDTPNSTPTSGLCIELRFPASLSMLPALLVDVAGQHFALPAVQIEQALAANMGQWQVLEQGELRFHYQERELPAYRLAERLGLPHSAEAKAVDLQQQAVVLVQHQHHIVALAVDALLDAREWLVTDLGRFSRHAKGATGVSILEGGELAVHLDLATLLAAKHTAAPHRDAPLATAQAAPLTRVLVVDDSYSVRSSLRQLLQDAGYAVDTARDGMEAIASLQAQAADIVLSDLEMPNMNGAELCSYLRAQPAWQQLPFIMISSRTQDKHRLLAEQAGVNAYLGKPYQEIELLKLMRELLQGSEIAAKK